MPLILELTVKYKGYIVKLVKIFSNKKLNYMLAESSTIRMEYTLLFFFVTGFRIKYYEFTGVITF